MKRQDTSSASWEDVTLPESDRRRLQGIAEQVRQRATLAESLGRSAKNLSSGGVSALFVGPSGTGKTLAAAALANDLGLSLYRIDLSRMVGKYIGETEKNLQRVFDAAEDGGAVLLFDEADALFGRRGGVKGGNERYANVEISYLLQRLESYPGIAILATNKKTEVDPAFVRRFRFVIDFSGLKVAGRPSLSRRPKKYV